MLFMEVLKTVPWRDEELSCGQRNPRADWQTHPLMPQASALAAESPATLGTVGPSVMGEEQRRPLTAADLDGIADTQGESV